MAPSAVLRFRNRGTGIFPAEAIAVPRTLLSLDFSELVPKLVAEFWPAVRDDVEGAAESAPESLEAQALTVNGKRAPKNGTLADIVTETENLDMCVMIKGADDIAGLWIPYSQIEGYVPPAGMTMTPPPKKRKGGVKAEGEAAGAGEAEDGDGPARRKIKRWDQTETDLLIELVQQHGKGKWRKVLEEGTAIFDTHRTTVDLKDKWRNLERSGLAPDVPDNPDTKNRRKRKTKEEAAEGAPAGEALPAAAGTGSHMDALTGAEIQPQFPAVLDPAADPAAAAAPMVPVEPLDVPPTSITSEPAVPETQPAAEEDKTKGRSTRARK